MTHEWGHAIGLAHSNTESAIMAGPPYTSYNSLNVPQPDDIRGCRCLYGLPTGVQGAYACSLPRQVDFGNVTIGTASAPQSVTLLNSGNAPMTLQTASVTTADFKRIAGCDPGTVVAPGASCTMQLARRGLQWSLGHVNRGNDFDAHGDWSAPRTDQARMTC